MKKIITTALVIAIAATLVNDIGRYAKTRYDLSVISQDTAAQIALSGKGNDRNKNAVAAAAYAAAKGATVYMYDQDDQQVRVWVEMPVGGMWLWSRVNAMQAGEPQGTPMKVQSESKSFWK